MDSPITNSLMNNKIVGEIHGDTYWTDRDSSKHFFRKQQGYPISLEIIRMLKEKGIKFIRIREHRRDGSQAVYEIYVSDYDNVKPFQEKGFDVQVCIPLR